MIFYAIAKPIVEQIIALEELKTFDHWNIGTQIRYNTYVECFGFVIMKEQSDKDFFQTLEEYKKQIKDGFL